MSDETAIEKSGINYETRVLLVGSLIGAMVGLVGSFVFIKKKERKGK